MRFIIASLISHLLFAGLAIVVIQLIQYPPSVSRHVNKMSHLFQATTVGRASTTSDQPLSINVSGQHSLHRIAELCNVVFRVVHESHDRKDAITKVTEKSNEISALLQEMAPARLTTSDDLVAEAIAIEDADQNAEERETDKPVAKWSMAHVHTYSYVPYVPDGSSSDPNPPEKHQTSTTFSVTFRDFTKLETILSNLTRDNLVRVDNLDWRITRKTRQALQKIVRQAALRNAMNKASDYAAVYSSAAIRPIEINDGFNIGSGDGIIYADANFARAAPPMGVEGNGQPDISFQPEEVAVSASVQVRFLVEL